MESWIGVDLDGTIAEYDHWRGVEHIGAPIGTMVNRVRGWLKDGHPVYGRVAVRIMTARVCAVEQPEREVARAAIQRWCVEHLGQVLEVTHEKDYGMLLLYDDRAVRVEHGSGRLIGGSEDPPTAIQRRGAPLVTSVCADGTHDLCSTRICVNVSDGWHRARYEPCGCSCHSRAA